ncbi:MAG TPA: response regulator, partial [Chthoniobacteraceae bacterium]|nr:response regulator [Chthoniobacteraceae bacterium]
APAGEIPRVPSSAAAVRGKTILVVEDHEDTRRVLSRALRRRGFGVTAAGSVAAAAEQFASSPADLIICDIGLPDGSGWDLMDRLRPQGPVRAIAVSGFGMENDVKKSREVGFLAHLTKPLDFNRLESLLVKTLAPASRPNPPAS